MHNNSTVEEIRRRWRDIYPHDAKDGIICPLCGSGSGPNGTGINSVKGEDNLLHCFACGFNGDVLMLYAEEHHLDCRADFPRIVGELAEQLGIPVEQTPRGAKKKAAAIRPGIKELTPTVDCLEQTDYLTRRGLSLETARHFKLSFIER